MSEAELLLRLLAGTGAGVTLGWQRALKHKSAGIRTFGLVGLGTAAATAIMAESVNAGDSSRVVQGVLTGIGFLGAGLIVRREGDTTPHGLTTAAAIWVAGALGCAAGLGQFPIVLTATLVAFSLLAVDHSIERWARHWRRPGRDEKPGPDQPPGENQTLGGSEPRSKTGTESGGPTGS